MADRTAWWYEDPPPKLFNSILTNVDMNVLLVLASAYSTFVAAVDALAFLAASDLTRVFAYRACLG